MHRLLRSTVRVLAPAARVPLCWASNPRSFRALNTATSIPTANSTGAIVQPSTATPPASQAVEADSFRALGVSQELAKRLHALNISAPTETQRVALPVLLSRQHALLKAETGSGKTICYLLPILDSLLHQVHTRQPGGQQLPIGLIVCPSPELVQQVQRVATSLVPELADLIRPCYGQFGVSRRQNAGLLIATPLAVKENVNFTHLSRLQYVVLDEADALLAGQHRDVTVGHILATFKQRHPAERPMHIFCAATFPNKGKSSAQAFLDLYYPPHEVVRLSTPHAHKPLHQHASHRFLQIDTSIPLTLEEQERVSRAEQRVAAMAQELTEEVGGEGDEEEAAAAAEGEGEGEGEEGPGAPGSGDAIARTMAARAAEEDQSVLKAGTATYASKVESLRRSAVLHALLRPARELGLVSSPGDASADGSATAAAAAPLPRSRRRSGAGVSSSLGQLTEDVPAFGRKASGQARRDKEAAAPLVTVDSLQAHSAASSASTVTATEAPSSAIPEASKIAPYSPPVPPIQQLSERECSLIPPTLIFVNSSEAAEATRKIVAAACPSLRVTSLHSGVPDVARAARLSDFSGGRVRVLVSTNLAARGLDTAHVGHVIQAEFATDVVAHLHRSGRTARAGRSGMVTSLVTRENMPLARLLLRAAAAGHTVDHAFSAKRSLRGKLKAEQKRMAEEAALEMALAGEKQGSAHAAQQ